MNNLERLDICPRKKMGSCAPCSEMSNLVEVVSFRVRPVGRALAELRSNVCPEGEEPVVPDIGIKRQNSARYRLRGR